jgi:alanine-synthesizing transaminase
MFARRTNWDLSPNALTLALKEHGRSSQELLDLTASNPTCVGLEYPARQIACALANERALSYEPAAKGLLVARQSVASYYAQQGIGVDPERMVLTVSTSEAYSYCFRLLCDPGDEVLVPSPSYPLFEFLADIQDVRLVPFELVYDEGWQIEFESLQRGISARSRAVLVVQPNNPTGSYVKRWELERLNVLCREHQLALIADEVFLDYNVESGERPSFAGNNGALSFALSGLSKISGLPQMKMAWIACSGPGDLAADAMNRLEVIADTYLSPNAPVQLATAALLEVRHSIQRQLGQRIRNNLAELDAQLSRQQLCHRLRVEGGWYVVLRVPAVCADEEFALDLLRKTNVLVHPGHFFNFRGGCFLVLSLITPETVFGEGLRRLITLSGMMNT